MSMTAHTDDQAKACHLSMHTITINGEPHSLVPIRVFRTAHHLSDSFGIGLFEFKDYTGLAALEQAGADLQTLRAHVLAALPHTTERRHLLNQVERLEQIFESALRMINPRIGLREPEIEFAVAGFGDFCRQWAYTLIGAQGETRDFDTVYMDWVNASLRVTQQEHTYIYSGETWTIRILNSLYGRIGLEVRTPNQTAYVVDTSYACPAEGFMVGLLREVSNRLQNTP